MTSTFITELREIAAHIQSRPFNVYLKITEILKSPPADAPPGWLRDFAGLPNQLFNTGFLEESITLARLTRHLQGPSLMLRRLPYIDEIAPERAEALRRDYNRRYIAPVARPPQTRRVDRSRPLRVGHLINSAEFSSAEYFLTAERRWHDRARVRLFHYYQQGAPVADPHPQDVWVNARPMSDEQLFDRIVADQIDILIDHCDINGGGRLNVLAARAAPIQVSRGGLMSSGLDALDWHRSDSYIGAPATLHEPWSERFFYTPCAQCYQPPDTPAPPARRTGAGGLRFGVFCQPGKIRPEMATLWARLLSQRPQASILFKRREYASPDAAARVRTLLRNAGADPAALRFSGWSEKSDHMADYADVDLCLDSFPFTGHTTTCESLWMGTPVVSRAGRTLCARLGPAYLHAAGCGDWIARDADDYVRIALDLTADTDRLHEIRQGLRAQVAASTLCDGVGYTRALEEAYAMMAEDANAFVSGKIA